MLLALMHRQRDREGLKVSQSGALSPPFAANTGLETETEKLPTSALLHRQRQRNITTKVRQLEL